MKVKDLVKIVQSTKPGHMYESWTVQYGKDIADALRDLRRHSISKTILGQKYSVQRRTNTSKSHRISEEGRRAISRAASERNRRIHLISEEKEKEAVEVFQDRTEAGLGPSAAIIFTASHLSIARIAVVRALNKHKIYFKLKLCTTKESAS